MKTIRKSADGLSVGSVQTEQELPFHHPRRMEADANAVLTDAAMWLTTGYCTALHLKHILALIDKKGLLHLLEENCEHSFDANESQRATVNGKVDRELLSLLGELD